MHGLETRDLEYAVSAPAAPQPGTPYRLLVREASAFEDREPLRDGPALDPCPASNPQLRSCPSSSSFITAPISPGQRCTTSSLCDRLGRNSDFVVGRTAR